MHNRTHSSSHASQNPFHASLTRTTVDAWQTIQSRGAGGTLQTRQTRNTLFSLGAVTARGTCTHRQLASVEVLTKLAAWQHRLMCSWAHRD